MRSGSLTAWAAGHGQRPEEALATVRAIVSGEEATVLSAPVAVPAAPVPSALAGLSPREQEVLALVARGLTNKQIAERLFIAPSTVKFHVTALLTKLEAETRTATWWPSPPQRRLL